jgi:uncharacterized membrane protein
MVKHKTTGIFVLFILDLILAVVLIPIFEVTTNLGYADATIGSFLIFVIILIVGSIGIGAEKADRKYHIHKRVGKHVRNSLHRKHKKA